MFIKSMNENAWRVIIIGHMKIKRPIMTNTRFLYLKINGMQLNKIRQSTT